MAEAKENERIYKLYERLTEENKTYYEELSLYINSKGAFKNEKEINSILEEILLDILIAQKDGISAESYFGKNSYIIADEIILNLNSGIKNNMLEIISGLVIFYLVIMGVDVIFPNKSLDIGSSILVIFIVSGVMAMVSRQVGVSVYKKHYKIYENIAYLISGLCYLFMIESDKIFNTPFKIDTSGSTGLIIIIFCALLSYMYFRREYSKKEMVRLILPTIIVLLLAGIITRIQIFIPYLIGESGKFIITSAIFVILGGYYFGLYLKSID
ncbi:DUF1129 domain-containing protein [Peptostreptococcus faecalis]|uniref:hypothetical protein n=1 Tax=Peptostreptococcus faecalis TaxID=2045015 RepID=UPI000C7BF500|nr:hypothetical protein [Peptostreptococcus faecalis]